jgi:hypothetical protein
MRLQPAPRDADSLPSGSMADQSAEPAGLVIGPTEREAVIRVLYVVKDNFWLDDVEESVLERLLEAS